MINALISLLLFAFIPSFVSYFLYYFILFPKYLQQKRFFLAIIYGILISVEAAMAAYILQRFFIETSRLIDMDNGGKNGRSTSIRVITVSAFIGSICDIVALVIRGFITWFIGPVWGYPTFEVSYYSSPKLYLRTNFKQLKKLS